MTDTQQNSSTCPVCQSAIDHGVEYPYPHPARYDGVSEWRCANGHRWGRWTGRVLELGDWEWPYGVSRSRKKMTLADDPTIVGDPSASRPQGVIKPKRN